MENTEQMDAKLKGIGEVVTESPQEPEERTRGKPILYKKQIKQLLPKEARIGKGVYATLNNTQKEDLQNILRLAYSNAKANNRTTLFAKDIRYAIELYKRKGAIYILTDFETVIQGKIMEMKKTLRGEN